MAANQSLLSLSSVLNKIDQLKPYITPSSSSSNKFNLDAVKEEKHPTDIRARLDGAPRVDEALESSIWYEFIDPTTSKPYYHCYTTNKTTWEKPSSFIAHNAYLGHSVDAQGSQNGYSFTGCFNKKDGRFSAQSYWDKVIVVQLHIKYTQI
jgi:hypothetical protein